MMHISELQAILKLKNEADQLKKMIEELENKYCDYTICKTGNFGSYSIATIDETLREDIICAVVKHIKRINEQIRAKGVEF